MIPLPRTWTAVSFGILTGDPAAPVEWLTHYRLCFEVKEHSNYFKGDMFSWMNLHPADYAFSLHYSGPVNEQEMIEVEESVHNVQTIRAKTLQPFSRLKPSRNVTYLP